MIATFGSCPFYYRGRGIYRGYWTQVTRTKTLIPSTPNTSLLGFRGIYVKHPQLPAREIRAVTYIRLTYRARLLTDDGPHIGYLHLLGASHDFQGQPILSEIALHPDAE